MFYAYQIERNDRLTVTLDSIWFINEGEGDCVRFEINMFSLNQFPEFVDRVVQPNENRYTFLSITSENREEIADQFLKISRDLTYFIPYDNSLTGRNSIIRSGDLVNDTNILRLNEEERSRLEHERIKLKTRLMEINNILD